jgi:hypothetical protein
MVRHIRDMAALLGVACLGLVACGVDGDTVRAGLAGAGQPSAVASITRAAATSSTPAVCDEPAGAAVPTPDVPTTQQLLIGTWLLCDTPSFFGTSDEIGLIIAADGHWAKLASGGAGSAVEMSGAANRGTWEVVPPGLQVNFTGLDGGIRISPVEIHAPATLVLNNNGVFIARYVRSDVTFVSAPTSGGTGCSAPEVENVPTPDAATTRQLLIGNWFLCDRPSFFGTPDEIGLVIAADGHWAKLVSDGAGGTVELNGPADRGTWELIDTSAMNGPGHFQMNFVGLDGGTRISSVRIIAPAKLLLNNNGVFVARYVRTPTLIPTE